jgi:type I restriction enzyme S subunit
MQVQVPVPSLDEQKQIVETLDDHLSRLDKALAEVSSAAKKTEAFIKSYLLSLVQGSASICHDSGSWQKREIGSLGKWRGGGTPSKSNPLFWLDGQIPWLTAKDMKTFRISDTQDHITEAGVAGSSANLFPSKAVVVVTRSGILEWKLPVAVTEVPVTVNQDLKALVCNADVLPEWAAYSILGFEHRILEECRKAGTTVANLNFEDFLKFEIFVPTIKRQQELSNLIQESVDYLDSVRARVYTLQTTLTDMRRSILKDAFLGALVKE